LGAAGVGDYLEKGRAGLVKRTGRMGKIQEAGIYRPPTGTGKTASVAFNHYQAYRILLEICTLGGREEERKGGKIKRKKDALPEDASRGLSVPVP